MASFFLGPAPLPDTFFIPGSNTPGNGVQLFIYSAGTTTKQTVYKDNQGNAAWTNPIVLDSGGNLPNGGVIWIPASTSIKAVWAPSNDTDPPASPYRTVDNISGINDTAVSQSEWVQGPTPTFVGANSFIMSGDQSATFTTSRRLKFAVTAGTVYGSVTNVTVASGSTTVNTAFGLGTSLDSGLSVVSYSLLDPSNPSINADYTFRKATANVPSSGTGTTNAWGSDADSVRITGTNAVFSFSTAPYVGAKRLLNFAVGVPLSSSAAITMPGDLNVTTSGGDLADIYATTLTTVILRFFRSNGSPFGIQTSGRVYAGPASGAATTATFRNLVASDIPGQGAVYLTTATVTSSVATVDFSSTFINSLYDNYILDLEAVVPVNSALLTIRLSPDNGGTFVASSYVYANKATVCDTGADDSTSSASAAFINLGGLTGTHSTSALGGMNLRAMLFNLNSTSQRKMISTAGAHPTTNGLTILSGGGAAYASQVQTTAVNAIRVIPNAGNISTGVFNLYGMRKSP